MSPFKNISPLAVNTECVSLIQRRQTSNTKGNIWRDDQESSQKQRPSFSRNSGRRKRGHAVTPDLLICNDNPKENEIRTQGHHASMGSPQRSETTNLQGNSEQIVTVELSHFNEAIQTHQNRFDSWQNALRQADSSINQNSGIT